MTYAWQNGEPGISFRDLMDAANPNPHLGKITSSNPCSEFVSLPWNSCNLGSLNLSNFANGHCVKDWDRLSDKISLAVRFLDDMISVNNLPLKEIAVVTKNLRSIGLGTMGLADLLYQLGIRYDSEEALRFVDALYQHIAAQAKAASQALYKERGTYPAWSGSEWEQRGVAIRNSNLLSIAPNGSIATIANTSGGIEPNFALVYDRRTNDGDVFHMVNPVFEAALKERGLYNDAILEKVVANKGNCQGIPEIPADIRDVFVIASDISPASHIAMVSCVQKHVDLSVSKTVNFSHSATIEDIENVYMDSWKKGCKGVTIYRDGSREQQTLSVNSQENMQRKPAVQYDSIAPVSRKELGTTHGSTYCKKTACGTIYITVNRDDDGNVVESFVHTSKGGICQANISAVNRMASLAMRSGVKIEEIVDQLQGISCQACLKMKSQGRVVDGVSCPDIIAGAIKEFKSGEVLPPAEQKKSLCPDCGAVLKHESGCVTCTACGWSKC